MRIFSNILNRFGYVKISGIRRQIGGLLRGFDGARTSRLESDWKQETRNINEDIRASIEQLRSRANELFKNNGYARRFVDMFVANVVGPDGFQLQVKSGDWKKDKKGATTFVYDEIANSMMEDRFADWSKRENCTVTGQQSFRGVTEMAAIQAARDGEYLVRKVTKRGKYGFQLQPLDPKLLDHRLNKDLGNGRMIISGIEFDEWRKPVAYHLFSSSPKIEALGTFYSIGNYERVPADEIYHGFRPEWPFQARGYTRLAPVMLSLRQLAGWEMAAVVNARLAAERPGYFVPGVDAVEETVPGKEKDSEGNQIIPSSLGEWGLIPKGWDVKVPDSQYPHAQHEMFVRGILRTIASGLGVSYNILANDLVGVNYSSIRAGLLDEREQWKGWQRWFIESFLEPVFTDWLEWAIMTGNLNLPMAKFEKFNKPLWTGRRWAWVDPLKDVEAEILQVQAGFKSSTQVIAEKGGDLTEIYQTLANEKAEAEALGLKLKIDEIKIIADKSANQDGMTPADEQKAMQILEHVRDLLKRTNGHHHEVDHE